MKQFSREMWWTSAIGCAIISTQLVTAGYIKLSGLVACIGFGSAIVAALEGYAE